MRDNFGSGLTSVSSAFLSTRIRDSRIADAEACLAKVVVGFSSGSSPLLGTLRSAGDIEGKPVMVCCVALRRLNGLVDSEKMG